MYVAVKGGETAIANAHRLLADRRRGDRDVPALTLDQIVGQLALAVDRVMAEGSLYDPDLAAMAVRQARGDLIEAIFLLRAYRTTLPRFGYAVPVETEGMRIERRVSATYKDLPGGQKLGPDLRLHAPPARPRHGGGHAGRRAGAPRRRQRGCRVPAGHRHPESRGADRGRRRPGRRGARRPHPRSERLPGRPRHPPAGAGTGRRGLHPGAGLFHAARVRPRPSLRGRGQDRARRRRGRDSGPRFRCADRIGPADRMPDGGAIQGQRRRPRTLHPRLRSRVRPIRAQSHGDEPRRPRAASRRVRRGAQRARAGRGIRAGTFRQCPGDGLRRTPEAAPLRRLPGRARPRAAPPGRGRGANGRSRRAPPRTRPHERDRSGLQFRLSRRGHEADDPPGHPQGDRDPRLPGALRVARDADALRLGHRRRAGDGRDPRASTTC